MKKIPPIDELLITLGLPPCNKTEHLDIFLSATVHKSYLIDSYQAEDQIDATKHYDRLEFLGDAVLKGVINAYLFQTFPHYNSGQLTKISGYIVSDKVLCEIAKDMDIAQYIRTGTGIRLNSVIADVMEAIWGAMYLVYGLDYTKETIIKWLAPKIEEVDLNQTHINENYKTLLQEYLQGKQMPLPNYKTLKDYGPAHDKTFEVGVLVGQDMMGIGIANSKKEASRLAAKQAYEKMIE